MKELKKMVDPEVLEVTFDEFDPFAKSGRGNTGEYVPTVGEFMEVLGGS